MLMGVPFALFVCAKYCRNAVRPSWGIFNPPKYPVICTLASKRCRVSVLRSFGLSDEGILAEQPPCWPDGSPKYTLYPKVLCKLQANAFVLTVPSWTADTKSVMT